MASDTMKKALSTSVKGEESSASPEAFTLFPGSCGRLDLPGSSVDAMYSSLQTKVAALDDELPLFPGHAYGGPSSTIGREKASGFLRPSITLGSWRKMMAR